MSLKSLNSVCIGEAYYTAMSQKNLSNPEIYLHPDVTFKGPFAELKEVCQNKLHIFGEIFD